MIGGFKLTLGSELRVGLVMEKTVGQGAAQLLVEQHEEQCDFGAFGSEPIGVTVAVALDQAVGFHFAKIVAQLVQAVTLVGEAIGREDGLMNLLGNPPRAGCWRRGGFP